MFSRALNCWFHGNICRTSMPRHQNAAFWRPPNSWPSSRILFPVGALMYSVFLSLCKRVNSCSSHMLEKYPSVVNHASFFVGVLLRPEFRHSLGLYCYIPNSWLHVGDISSSTSFCLFLSRESTLEVNVKRRDQCKLVDVPNFCKHCHVGQVPTKHLSKCCVSTDGVRRVITGRLSRYAQSVCRRVLVQIVPQCSGREVGLTRRPGDQPHRGVQQYS
jgi:hypothetical protein